MRTAICEHCGREFTPNRGGWAKACSFECRKARQEANARARKCARTQEERAEYDRRRRAGEIAAAWPGYEVVSDPSPADIAFRPGSRFAPAEVRHMIRSGYLPDGAVFRRCDGTIYTTKRGKLEKITP